MKRKVFGHSLFNLIISSSICLDNVMMNIFCLVFEDEYSGPGSTAMDRDSFT